MNGNAKNQKPGKATDEKAERTKSTSASWRFQILVLLALAATLGFGFMVYITDHRDYLIQRNFRLLGDMSNQIKESLVNLDTALHAAFDYSNDVAWSQDVLSQLQPPAHLLNKSSTDKGPAQPSTNIICDWQALGIKPVLEGRTNWLYLTYTNINASADAPKTERTVVARVDLSELLVPILKRHEFTDVLLTDANGQAVFQLSTAEERATNALAESDWRITRVPAFSAESETNRIRGTCLLDKVEITGTSFKLFAQPLQVGFGQGETSAVDWWVCGLVRGKDFKAACWALPTTATIGFVFAALAVLIAWPFFNICLNGAHSEVRRLEVVWLIAGGFLGCSAATFLLLYRGTYLCSEEMSDDELHKLAFSVHQKLVTEFSQARNLLDNFDVSLVNEIKSGCSTQTNLTLPLVKTRAFQDLKELTNTFPIEAFWSDSTGKQMALWSPQMHAPAPVPVADRAYFQNIVGNLGWQWAEVLANTNFPNLIAPPGERFYVESIFSRSRGDNVAAFSRSFSQSSVWTNITGVLSNPPSVVALTFKPLSLFSVVLPAGYGFCILDPTGKVLFHSNSSQNLRENFISEAEQDLALQAAVNARTHADFDARYCNRTYHVSVQPVQGLPWTLAAFRNEQVLGSVHRNILLTGGILYLAYWSVLGLVALAGLGILRWRTGDAFSLFWPTRRYCNEYKLCALVCGALAIAIFVFCVCLHRSDRLLLLVLVLLPVLLVAIALLLRGITPFLGAVPDKLPFRFVATRYTLCLYFIFVLFALVPAFGCYRLSFLQEMRAYVKAEQLKVGRELQQRPALKTLKAGKWPTDPRDVIYWQGVRTHRQTNALNRHFDFFWGMNAQARTSTSEAGIRIDEAANHSGSHVESDWFIRLYEACRPRFRDPELRTSALTANQAKDNSWHCELHPRELKTTLEGGDDHGQPGTIEMTSELPPMAALPPLWPESGFETDTLRNLCWYVGLGLVLVAPLIFARFIVAHVFLTLLPGALRDPARAVPRHAALATPAKWSQNKRDEPEAFASSERTHIQFVDPADQLDQASESLRTLKNEGKLGPGTVLVVSPATPSEQAQVRKKAQAGWSINPWIEELEKPENRTVIAVFDKNCIQASELWKLASKEDAELAFESEDEGERRYEVARMLSTKYQELWNECSVFEKLTLYQVARTGFASITRPELRTLLDKKLLRFGPKLCLRNESFRRFVIATFKPSDVADCLAAEPPSFFSWHSIRGPLGIVISAGALFLFATQRELWQLGMGVATSFAAASDRLTKIAGLFQKTKGDSDEGDNE